MTTASEEYLSALQAEKPQMLGSLCLLHGASAGGKGGSSPRIEWAQREAIPCQSHQGGTLEMPRAVCQRRSRSLQP